jgi:lipoprotein-releasing system ATP-binding protein
MNSQVVLELRNISKEFRQGTIALEVLKNINLIIRSGESIAIIGDSGSGKSTLLHIAGLLDDVTSGEVIYPVLSADGSTKEQLRLSQIGFVYQYHHLLPDFSARENIAMPRIIAGKNKNQALSDADQLLDQLGMSGKSHNLPGELSGGQQQRVAIARALINNPSIILADEPTGNLDPATAEVVFDLLLSLTKTNNTALLMVTHNHQLALRLNRIYELKDDGLFLSQS